MTKQLSHAADGESTLAFEVGGIKLTKYETLRADIFDHESAGHHVELRMYEGPAGYVGKPTARVIRLSFGQAHELRVLLDRVEAKAAYYGRLRRERRASDVPTGKAAAIAGRLGD